MTNSISIKNQLLYDDYLNLGKTPLGKLKNAKNELTLADAGRLYSTKSIGKFFYKVKLFLEGKGFVTKQKLNDLYEKTLYDTLGAKIEKASNRMEEVLGKFEEDVKEKKKSELWKVKHPGKLTRKIDAVKIQKHLKGENEVLQKFTKLWSDRGERWGDFFQSHVAHREIEQTMLNGYIKITFPENPVTLNQALKSEKVLADLTKLLELNPPK